MYQTGKTCFHKRRIDFKKIQLTQQFKVKKILFFIPEDKILLCLEALNFYSAHLLFISHTLKCRFLINRQTHTLVAC